MFVGYAGWGPSQLAGELTRNSWYMVATDSGTLLKELGRQAEGADPRDAGLGTWTLLMNMIGRSETAKENTSGFDDLVSFFNETCQIVKQVSLLVPDRSCFSCCDNFLDAERVGVH